MQFMGWKSRIGQTETWVNIIDNTIFINGENANLMIDQSRDETVVYAVPSDVHRYYDTREVHKMPSKHYCFEGSRNHQSGLDSFTQDLMSLLDRNGTAVAVPPAYDFDKLIAEITSPYADDNQVTLSHEDKYNWLADFFNFDIPDESMAQLFIDKALEVCVAISADKVRQFTEDAKNYKWYLVMCHLPFLSNKIEHFTNILWARWKTKGDIVNFENPYQVNCRTINDWNLFIFNLSSFARGGNLPINPS